MRHSGPPGNPTRVSERFSLVAVHGNGGGAFRFARMRPFVAPDVDFVPVTLPGFGGRAADPALHSIRDYAARLGELVAASPEPRILLGHGIGGSLLLELLQIAPRLAEGVLLHAPVGASLDRRWFPRLMKPLWVREAGKLAFASPLLRSAWTRLLFRQAPPADYLAEFFAEYRRCQAFAQMFDLITAEWFAGLAPVRVPSVLLWGARERVLRAGQHEQFLPLLPGARVHIEPEWDHFPMIEQPAEYADVVTGLARSLLREKLAEAC